ncbi:hypothetical protein O3G_MSEX013945 [Manduca sexta]|uniref:Cuticle protein n=1 Tax=Manduca sexta TaxID=7130 RepID=A0A922CZ84_MANSE|nr:hypothetical protein O3G_MSEX013945 [Manduca sexta]
MFFKVVILVGLVGFVSAKHAFSSQHVNKHDGPAEKVQHHDSHGHEHHYDYHAHPKYDFEYKIEDDHTGDHKNQHETRDGDVVKGFYEFKDSDGHIRRVEYHADKHSGFHAVVKHSTHQVKQQKNMDS